MDLFFFSSHDYFCHCGIDISVPTLQSTKGAENQSDLVGDVFIRLPLLVLKVPSVAIVKDCIIEDLSISPPSP